MSAASGFDGVDVADQVGNGHVGRGELFHVAVFRSEPRNRRAFTALGKQIAASAANRRVGVVVNFASGDVGHLRIEQGRKGAKDAAFGLSAQAEQNEIVARENRVHDLRDDGVVVADDSGKNRGVFAEDASSGCRAVRPSHGGYAAFLRKRSFGADSPRERGRFIADSS